MTAFYKEYKFKRGYVGFLPMDSITANLFAHDGGVIDDFHRYNIDRIKTLMKQGWAMPPIKVKQNGVRQTGFKRWNACLELGHTEINCEIVDNYSLKKW